ncbi:hypothetical protein HGM15179_019236 [Zosterops borbonicus]|uniref:Mitochondrial import inner membrane translocase subunit Tim29 n=1 Tax=Zosterops borbonicus TaxID=364589 RepID=A0A8K1DAX6_9PASS|nr:hypothetical protein HGM15179_019236 [Zosterops borbonicus]
MAAAAAAGGTGRGLWRRLGDTRLALWCRSLLQDYSTSIRDTLSSARRRPGTAVTWVTLLGLGSLFTSSVPDRDSLEAAAVAATAALGQLPGGSRSPRCERRVLRLSKLRERGQILVKNFIFFSVALADPHGREPALYRARCPHLQPRLWGLSGELLDVGVLGRWWGLEEALRDSDINEEEFGHLPEGLRRLRSRDLRSEHNERLHRERLRHVTVNVDESDGE